MRSSSRASSARSVIVRCVKRAAASPPPAPRARRRGARRRAACRSRCSAAARCCPPAGAGAAASRPPRGRGRPPRPFAASTGCRSRPRPRRAGAGSRGAAWRRSRWRGWRGPAPPGGDRRRRRARRARAARTRPPRRGPACGSREGLGSPVACMSWVSVGGRGERTRASSTARALSVEEFSCAPSRGARSGRSSRMEAMPGAYANRSGVAIIWFRLTEYCACKAQIPGILFSLSSPFIPLDKTSQEEHP